MEFNQNHEENKYINTYKSSKYFSKSKARRIRKANQIKKNNERKNIKILKHEEKSSDNNKNYMNEELYCNNQLEVIRLKYKINLLEVQNKVLLKKLKKILSESKKNDYIYERQKEYMDDIDNNKCYKYKCKYNSQQKRKSNEKVNYTKSKVLNKSQNNNIVNNTQSDDENDDFHINLNKTPGVDMYFKEKYMKIIFENYILKEKNKELEETSKKNIEEILNFQKEYEKLNSLTNKKTQKYKKIKEMLELYTKEKKIMLYMIEKYDISHLFPINFLSFHDPYHDYHSDDNDYTNDINNKLYKNLYEKDYIDQYISNIMKKNKVYINKKKYDNGIVISNTDSPYIDLDSKRKSMSKEKNYPAQKKIYSYKTNKNFIENKENNEIFKRVRIESRNGVGNIFGGNSEKEKDQENLNSLIYKSNDNSNKSKLITNDHKDKVRRRIYFLKEEVIKIIDINKLIEGKLLSIPDKITSLKQKNKRIDLEFEYNENLKRINLIKKEIRIREKEMDDEQLLKN